MPYQTFDVLNVPVEGKSVAVPTLQFGEPRTFDYSMAFARMLAPRAILMKQYHTIHPNGQDPVSCAICWLSGNFHNMPPLPCGHRFHRDCIRKWFEAQSRPPKRSPSCPTCRKPMSYKCGHLVDIDAIQPHELWHPDELMYNCFVSPKRYRRAVSPPPCSPRSEERREQSKKQSQASKREHRLRASHMMGERPLGWIIAWALDGTEMVSQTDIPPEGRHPSVILDSPRWDEHLKLMLGFLRQLADSRRAERKLQTFWASFEALDHALGALQRCEEEDEQEKDEDEDSDHEAPSTSYYASSPPSARMWAARLAWRRAFERAQRHLEYFLTLEEVLGASKRVYSTLDRNSRTATYNPWLWRYRRRSLGLPADHRPARDFPRLKAWGHRVGKWLDRWLELQTGNPPAEYGIILKQDS